MSAPREGGFPVAILAGGLATRMRPATERIPKALLEVAGRPFVEHQLALLRREGVGRVVLCVGFLGEMIEAAIGDGARFGLEVSYSFDGEKLLGTGGALRQALPRLGERFFVLYGDSYLEIGYAAVQAAYRRSGLPALMTVFRNEGRWDTSNVLFDGSRIVRYDKRHPTADMKFIDYGLGILNGDVLRAVRAGAFDLSDLYTALALEGRLAGYEATRRFYEIGTPSGLAEADSHLRGQSQP
ncbi:MAG: nucleotidyltransferase family protein [Bradyrhizobium sp.]|nr:nucleotidyltransferase family protein [Bradyrhizobium sp.]